MCEKIIICIFLSSVCSLSHARREDGVVVRFVRPRVIYYPPPDILKQRRVRDARRKAIEKRKAILISRKEQRERNERISRAIREYKFRKLVQEQNKTPVPQEKNQFRSWKIIYSRKGPKKDDYREWKESLGKPSSKQGPETYGGNGLRKMLGSLGVKRKPQSRRKKNEDNEEGEE